MIFHSIVPIDFVFANFNQNSSGEGKYIEVEYLGEKVQVSPVTNNEYVIVRLISTSPKSYLNPRLQPGSIIKGTL